MNDSDSREESLLRQIESFKSQIQSGAQQARSTREETERLASENAALRARCETLEREKTEIRDEAIAAIEEGEKESANLLRKLEQAQKDLSRYQTDEAAWISEKQGYAANLHAIESLLKEVRADRERLQAGETRLRDEVGKLRDQEKQILRERDEARASLKKSEETLAQIRKDLPALQKALPELDAKVRESARELDQARKQNTALQQRITALEAEKSAQQKKLEEDFQRTLREKEEALHGRVDELDQARKSHTQLEDRLKLNLRELDALRLEKKQLEANLHAARENTDAAARARNALQSKEEELGVKETENRQLREQQDAVRARLTEAEGLLASLRAEKERLTLSIEKIKEDAAGQLGAVLAAKDAELRDLQSRLQTRTHEAEVSRKQAEARQQALHAEEEKVRTLERHIARLKAQIQEEEGDWQQALDAVEQYRSQAMQLGEKNLALEAELQSRRHELTARQHELALLKEQIQTLQGSLSMMKSELLQHRNIPQTSRETDWILSGISILAQQARSGNPDLKGALKVWLAESERGPRSPSEESVAPAPVRAEWPPAPAPSASVQITPPELVPGSSPIFGTTGHHLRQLEQVDLPGDLVISLDELRCAVIDPVWRDKWKAGEKPNAFLGDDAAQRGKAPEIFHVVARDFLDWLVRPEGVNDPAQFGEKELWQYMYELFAAERLDRLVQRNDFEGTNFLSRRLRTFCRRLAAVKERTPGFHSWNDVLLSEWREMPRVVFPLQERRLVVHGRLYGLRSHPRHTVEIAAWHVEADHPDAGEAADLALHALLFHKARPESAFTSSLEFYTQDFSAREVSRADLNRVLRSRVVPAFYELAGMPKPPGLADSGIDFFPPTHATEIV